MKPSLKTSEKTYLGIDPGTTTIGYGLVRDVEGVFECLDYGVISNPGKDSVSNFINTRKSIQRLVSKYKPSVVAVEKLFFFKNHKTVLPVSEMRGVIMLSLGETGIKIHEFTPLQVKQTICNYGLADKNQVKRMVKSLLHLEDDVKPDDAADALALAMCCATRPIDL